MHIQKSVYSLFQLLYCIIFNFWLFLILLLCYIPFYSLIPMYVCTVCVFFCTVYILGKLFLILMCCMFQSEALPCVFYMYSAHVSLFSCSDYSKFCSTLTPDMCYHISVHINKLKHSNRDFDLAGHIHSHKWDATNIVCVNPACHVLWVAYNVRLGTRCVAGSHFTFTHFPTFLWSLQFFFLFLFSNFFFF